METRVWCLVPPLSYRIFSHSQHWSWDLKDAWATVGCEGGKGNMVAARSLFGVCVPTAPVQVPGSQSGEHAAGSGGPSTEEAKAGDVRV